MQLAITAGLIAATATLAQAQFQPMDLAAFYTSDHNQFCCEAAQYPCGNVTFLGIPFYMGPSGANNTIVLNGTNPVTLDIPVNQSGVQLVRTLINTAWGQPGPNSYLRIEFHGIDGTVSFVDLVGGRHIRDYGPGFTQGFEQNPPTCTRNVFVATGRSVKADMQTIALPASIRENGLAFIRFIDTGAVNFQRGLVFAITLDSRICEANINDDCQVDIFDYLDFIDRFSSSNPEADFNGDGTIDFFDYLDFVQAFANGC